MSEDPAAAKRPLEALLELSQGGKAAGERVWVVRAPHRNVGAVLDVLRMIRGLKQSNEQDWKEVIKSLQYHPEHVNVVREVYGEYRDRFAPATRGVGTLYAQALLRADQWDDALNVIESLSNPDGWRDDDIDWVEDRLPTVLSMGQLKGKQEDFEEALRKRGIVVPSGDGLTVSGSTLTAAPPPTRQVATGKRIADLLRSGVPTDLDHAIVMLNAAMAEGHANGLMVNNVAKSLGFAGRPDDVKTLIDTVTAAAHESNELEGLTPSLLPHLAHAYWNAGKPKLAAQLYLANVSKPEFNEPGVPGHGIKALVKASEADDLVAYLEKLQENPRSFSRPTAGDYERAVVAVTKMKIDDLPRVGALDIDLSARAQRDVEKQYRSHRDPDGYMDFVDAYEGPIRGIAEGQSAASMITAFEDVDAAVRWFTWVGNCENRPADSCYDDVLETALKASVDPIATMEEIAKGSPGIPCTVTGARRRLTEVLTEWATQDPVRVAAIITETAKETGGWDDPLTDQVLIAEACRQLTNVRGSRRAVDLISTTWKNDFPFESKLNMKRYQYAPRIRRDVAAEGKRLASFRPELLREWIRAYGFVNRRDDFEGVRHQFFAIHKRLSDPGVTGHIDTSEHLRLLTEGWSDLWREGGLTNINNAIKSISEMGLRPTAATYESRMVATKKSDRTRDLPTVREALGSDPFTAGLWTTFILGELVLDKPGPNKEFEGDTTPQRSLVAVERAENMICDALKETVENKDLAEVDRMFSQGELTTIAEAYPVKKLAGFAGLFNDYMARRGSTPKQAFRAFVGALARAHSRGGSADGVERAFTMWKTGLLDEDLPADLWRARITALRNTESPEDVVSQVRKVIDLAKRWDRRLEQSILLLLASPQANVTADECFALASAMTEREDTSNTWADGFIGELALMLAARGETEIAIEIVTKLGKKGQDISERLAAVKRGDVVVVPQWEDAPDTFGPGSLTNAQFQAFQGLVAHRLGGTSVLVKETLRYLQDTDDEASREVLRLTIDSSLPDLIEARERMGRLTSLLKVARLVSKGSSSKEDGWSGTAIIDEVVSGFGETIKNRKIHLTKDFEKDWLTVSNSAVVAFCLENVIANAVTAVQGNREGARSIRIGLSYDPASEDHDGRAAHGYVVFSVKDSGPGLPDKVRKNLYTNNYTNDPDHGLGIGLRSTAEAIALSDGAMEADPSETSGTRMLLRFPASATAAAKNEEGQH